MPEGTHHWEPCPLLHLGWTSQLAHTHQCSTAATAGPAWHAVAALTPPQQEDTHGPYTGSPWSTQLRWPSRIALLKPIKPLLKYATSQDWEKQRIYRKHKGRTSSWRHSQHHLSLGRCKIKWQWHCGSHITMAKRKEIYITFWRGGGVTGMLIHCC